MSAVDAAAITMRGAVGNVMRPAVEYLLAFAPHKRNRIMAIHTLPSRIYVGIAGFLSVVRVMLSAAVIAKRMRWSSVTKRLVSVK
jgi:hypothetical protein